MDPEVWVEKKVLPFIERDEKNEKYVFPNMMKDYIRNSHLHSWYKHYRYCPGKVYPCLRIGEESRYSFNESKSDNKLHWCFINSESIFDKSSGYHKDNIPWKIIQHHHFHLSHHYDGFGAHNPIELFHSQTMIMECYNVMDQITRILLKIDPNPPTKQIIYNNPYIDPSLFNEDGEWENKLGFIQKEKSLFIIIKDKLYKYEYEQPLPDYKKIMESSDSSKSDDNSE